MTPLATKALAAIGIPTLLVTLAHINSLPFAYTIRSWWLLRSLVERAKKVNLEPEDLFTVVSQKQRCMWDDIDYNQHMNNSTYNKKLDFCRIHLLYIIVPRIMMEPDHHIFAHNAGVFILFKREIPPLQPYTIQTRVWTWNEKWLFLQHRFIIEHENGNLPTVCCIATSKIVFKQTSGKTVSPMEIFKLCGHPYDDVQVEKKRSENWEIAKNLLTMQHDWSGNSSRRGESKL